MINPENIHCLALNYTGVGENTQPPLYFVKSKNALCFNDASVPFAKNSTRMWTEVELGIVVNNDCYEIEESNANNYIEGYIVCADITCENIHMRDHHLAFAKSRKNFCPVSNTVVKLSSFDLVGLKLSTYINGELTQSGSSDDMFFNPFKSLSYISHITPLCKGDIILTGTPSGVENNTITPGDKILHKIDKIGELSFNIEL